MGGSSVKRRTVSEAISHSAANTTRVNSSEITDNLTGELSASMRDPGHVIKIERESATEPNAGLALPERGLALPRRCWRRLATMGKEKVMTIRTVVGRQLSGRLSTSLQ